MTFRHKSKLYKYVFVLLLGLLPLDASGKTNSPACSVSAPAKAIVGKIHENGDLELTDGRRVRLVGVLPVRIFTNPKSEQAKHLNKLGREAIELLRRYALGKEIEIHQNGRMRDRYDRLLAHIRIAKDAKGIWLQKALLDKGLARSYSYRDNRACIAQMLAFEQKARAKRLGIWRSRVFNPVSADKTGLLMKKRYRFTLVEGRVKKVARSKKWMFINFGKDWRSDFSIAIKNKYGRQIGREGFELTKLAGKNVRVRGWIERWNGPLIKVTHKEQIEVLEENE